METATFGAGCFWGVEAAFRKQRGVISTEVGYAGGHLSHPTYKDVCSDRTGHAEVVRIVFDPARVSYEQLLRLFFEIHDPTTKNRQGPDVGSQYRSIIFYHTPEQEKTAREFVQELEVSGQFEDRLVTEIVPEAPFYRAEEYHQRYHEKHGGNCQI
jgi:peptide-methionine (S)-S-oxide reductase